MTPQQRKQQTERLLNAEGIGGSMKFDSPRRAIPAGCLWQSVSLRSAFDCAANEPWIW
jgi:hypothetical protein